MRTLLFLLTFGVLVSQTSVGQAPASPERPSRRPEQQVPPGVKAIRDVEYVPGGGASRSLDLFLPENVEKPPLVVWIHGGAWSGGNKQPNQAMMLTRQGFATASINYRLSREAIFPAQIEDCKAAIRFLRANAGRYGYDAERVGVWGSSAGGHLVALLGTTGDVKELEGNGANEGVSSRIQAVCNFFGPANLLTMGAQSGPNSRINHDAPDSPEAKLIGGPVQQNKEKATIASPVTYVTPDDAPFLHVHGDQDPVVPMAQSEELHAALQKAKVESTLHIVKGGGHGTGFNHRELAPMVVEFFRKHLAKKD